MLKLVGLLFALVGSILAVENSTVVEADNVVEVSVLAKCVYWSEMRQFSCRRQNESSQCDVVPELPVLEQNKSVVQYGIGKACNETGNVKFPLYEKDAVQERYLNSSVYVNGVQVQLCLFHSNASEAHGFRFPDLSCYQRMVDLLSSENFYRVVDLSDSRQAELIGDVIVSNQIRKRRFSKKTF